MSSSLTDMGGGDLLGPPPVIAGEDANEFKELLERVSDDVKTGRYHRGNLGARVWEARRLRRLKASLLQIAAPEGLERVLMPLVDGYDEAEELSSNQTACQQAH
jgi:hypothetical protein